MFLPNTFSFSRYSYLYKIYITLKCSTFYPYLTHTRTNLLNLKESFLWHLFFYFILEVKVNWHSFIPTIFSYFYTFVICIVTHFTVFNFVIKSCYNPLSFMVKNNIVCLDKSFKIIIIHGHIVLILCILY